MTKAKAIIFDIDGTLSPEISWLALTRDLGASVEEHTRIYEELKTGAITYIDAKHQLLDLWRASGNANQQFFRRLFENWPFDPAAVQVFDRLKHAYLLCLITGSMDLYAEIAAAKLGVEHWYANTTLHWDEHGQLIDMDYELNQANKKLEQFIQFCDQQKLQPNDCIVVGDGENDVELFRLSANGILVRHDDNPLPCALCVEGRE